MCIKGKHIKKTIGILCVLAVLMSTLAGCKNSGGTANDSAVGGTIDSNAEHISISILSNSGGDTTGIVPGQVFQQLQTLCNATIDIKWALMNTYTAQFNVMMAAGNLPDVVLVPDVKMATFVDAVKRDQFWQLDSYMTQMSNGKNINAIALQNSKTDGKQFILPRQRDVKRIRCVYRADWAKAAGLGVPDTMAKIYEMAKTFAGGDYDGNGKKDTMGLCLSTSSDGGGSSIGGLNAMVVANDGINKWGLSNGKIINMIDNSHYLDTMQQLNKLYGEGAISPDFSIQATGDVKTGLFDKEKEGLTVTYDLPPSTSLLVKAKIAANPSLKRSDIVNYTYLKDSAGNTKVPQEAGFAGGYAFTKSSIKDAARLKECLAVFNQFLSKEGQNLLNNGIEGREYTLNADGESCKILDANLNLKEVSSLTQLYIGSNLTYSAFDDDLSKALFNDSNTYKSSGELIPDYSVPLTSPTWTDSQATLYQIIDTAQIKYIMGQLTLDQFKAEIKRWHTSGGDKVESEFTSSYKGKPVTVSSSTSSVLSSSK